MNGSTRIFEGRDTRPQTLANTDPRFRETLLFPFIAAVIIGAFQAYFPSTVPLERFLVVMGAFSLVAYAVSFSPLPYGRLRGLVVPAFILAGSILFWLLHDASRGHEVIYYIAVSQLILWGYTLVRRHFRAVLVACWTLSFIALLIVQIPPFFPKGADIVGIALLIAINLLGFYIVRCTRRLAGIIHSLSHKAHTDEVTGVANRHHVTELMQHECAKAKRAGQPLSLLLVDVDHFKTINDRYGHLAGDAVLRTLAHCIERTIRACDIFGRYGGDEFAILLPDVDPAGARVTAQRVVTAIAGSTTVDSARRIDFNVSIGIASHHCSTQCSLDGLIRAADDALYRAKQGGCNGIHVASDPGVDEPEPSRVVGAAMRVGDRGLDAADRQPEA